MSETQQPLEHWPTERMVLEGHAEYALAEDLEDLSMEDLKKVAEICEVNEFAPDECISCLAHVMWLDRQKERLESMAPEEFPADHPLREVLEENAPEDPEPFVLPDMKDRASSEEGEADDFIPVEVQRRPYVETLQLQLAMMQNTIEEILHGPPIPPKDVSVEELALLALGATKWVESTEFNVSQGLELSSQQRQVLDATKALVARLKS